MTNANTLNGLSGVARQMIESRDMEIEWLRSALQAIEMHELRDWEDYEAIQGIAERALKRVRRMERPEKPHPHAFGS